MENAENVKEQMNNISQDITMPRKNQKIKSKELQTKNILNELLYRLKNTEERISVLKDMLIKTPQNKMQRKKRM